jgi:hypothetical protein
MSCVSAHPAAARADAPSSMIPPAGHAVECDGGDSGPPFSSGDEDDAAARADAPSSIHPAAHMLTPSPLPTNALSTNAELKSARQSAARFLVKAERSAKDAYVARPRSAAGSVLATPSPASVPVDVSLDHFSLGTWGTPFNFMVACCLLTLTGFVLLCLLPAQASCMRTTATCCLNTRGVLWFCVTPMTSSRPQRSSLSIVHFVTPIPVSLSHDLVLARGRRL